MERQHGQKRKQGKEKRKTGEEKEKDLALHTAHLVQPSVYPGRQNHESQDGLLFTSYGSL